MTELNTVEETCKYLLFFMLRNGVPLYESLDVDAKNT